MAKKIYASPLKIRNRTADGGLAFDENGNPEFIEIAAIRGKSAAEILNLSDEAFIQSMPVFSVGEGTPFILDDDNKQITNPQIDDSVKIYIDTQIDEDSSIVAAIIDDSKNKGENITWSINKIKNYIQDRDSSLVGEKLTLQRLDDDNNLQTFVSSDSNKITSYIPLEFINNTLLEKDGLILSNNNLVIESSLSASSNPKIVLKKNNKGKIEENIVMKTDGSITNIDTNVLTLTVQDIANINKINVDTIECNDNFKVIKPEKFLKAINKYIFITDDDINKRFNISNILTPYSILKNNNGVYDIVDDGYYSLSGMVNIKPLKDSTSPDSFTFGFYVNDVMKKEIYLRQNIKINEIISFVLPDLIFNLNKGDKITFKINHVIKNNSLCEIDDGYLSMRFLGEA